MRKTNITLIRSSGERLFIGEGPNEIIVTVSAVDGRKATLNFNAPENVKIDREERRLRQE